MEMRIDERGAEQQAARVHRLVRWGLQAFGHFGDAATLYGDGHVLAAVGQGGVGDEQVEHGEAGVAVGFIQDKGGCGA